MTLKVSTSLDAGTLCGSNSFDLAFFSCGYESRCIHFFNALHGSLKNIYVFDYSCPGQGSYDQNARVYKSLKHISIIRASTDSASLRAEIFKALKSASSGKTCINVYFDISSSNRKISAIVLELLYFLASNGVESRLTVSYVYSKYVPAPEATATTQTFEPVTPFYSGWSLDSGLPVSLIIGLGYEKGRALSAIEFLEPRRTIAFCPNNGSGSFDKDTGKEYSQIAKSCPSIERHDYNVKSFESLFWSLDSAISGLKENSRVVIIPMGPKLFHLGALLCALSHRPRVHLYRISGGSNDPPVDRVAEAGSESYIHIVVDKSLCESRSIS